MSEESGESERMSTKDTEWVFYTMEQSIEVLIPRSIVVNTFGWGLQSQECVRNSCSWTASSLNKTICIEFDAFAPLVCYAAVPIAFFCDLH